MNKTTPSQQKINEILEGDCLQVLPTLPADCVDLVITSPPYNLGDNHHTGNKRHSSYFDDLPETEYRAQQVKVLDGLFRVVKPGGSLFYNHKNRIKDGVSITPYSWISKSKWVVKQEIVWFNGSQNFDKIRFYPMTERVYWLTKSPSTKLINVINHHDLFTREEWSPVGTAASHTRAFPEKMVRDILACFPEAEVVLDPYMGSGTTALVAKRLGKSYLGIELNPDYVKLSNERLSQEVLL